MKKSITNATTEGQTNATTEEQREWCFKFVRDAAESVLKEPGFGNEEIQKLIKNGDKLQRSIVMAVRKFSVNIQFADEEAGKSLSGYPSGYKPKEITEQVNQLRGLFPEIGSADEKLSKQDLPPHAEGWFAIPRWERIAPTYGEAVRKVLDLLKHYPNGAFANYCNKKLDPQYLRQSQKTSEAFQKLGDEQKDHDILVVPAQFGIRHQGRSVRRAREVMNANEFGLGAFAIGIMLLTHPKRFESHHDLDIDCAGDEFAPDADGDFRKAPLFKFHLLPGDAWGSFDTESIKYPRIHFGSASGFIR